MKRWIKRVAVALLGVVFVAFAAGWLANEPRPEGVPGPEAEALAHRVQAAVNLEAWNRTGALWWNFDGRQSHLWDRRRGFARVRWGDNEVLLDIDQRTGVAKQGGRDVSGPEKAALIEKAYRHWVNDSFWLNPLAKLFDGGTERSIVKVDGRDALLITYGRGGVTPGDVYLWIVGEDGVPTAWRMWVKILPIGGLEFSWERWKTLSTGAKVATFHQGLVGVEMKDVLGATSVLAIEPEDPFLALTTTGTGAASRPAAIK